MTGTDLETVIARTGGHERFRELTAEDNPDVRQRDAYRALVARLAAGEPLAPPAAGPDVVPLSDSLRVVRLGFQRCWFSTQDDACGCSGVRCHLLGRIVSLLDCVECLS